MEKKEWVFPQAKKPKDCFLAAGILAFLTCCWSISLPFVSTEPMGVVGAIACVIGCFLLVSPVWVMFVVMGLIKVTLSHERVVLSLGKRELKRLEADRICTIAKGFINLEKGIGTALYVSATAAEEIEQKGEAALGKNRIVRNNVKFRKGKSDWKALCLGAGLVKLSDAIHFEFTEDRRQLLIDLFPDAEYRVGKHFNDPPSLV